MPGAGFGLVGHGSRVCRSNGPPRTERPSARRLHDTMAMGNLSPELRGPVELELARAAELLPIHAREPVQRNRDLPVSVSKR